MTATSISPAQTRAFRAWLLEVINLDDLSLPVNPLLFTEQNCQWSPRDMPHLGDRYLLLRVLGYVPPQETEMIKQATPGSGGTRVTRYWRDIGEWVVTVQCVSRMPERAKSHELSASLLLQPMVRRFMGTAASRLGLVGLGPLRRGNVTSLPTLVKDSQWETRASIDLTYSVSNYIAEEDWRVRSTEGTATLGSLPPQDVVYGEE